MIRLGRTFGGLMVGGRAGEREASRARSAQLAIASGAREKDVEAALAAAGGDARVALVSLLAGVDPSAARERLDGARRLGAGRSRRRA